MVTVIHDPENEQEITKLYAFLSVDERGNEGILGGPVGELGYVPLITGNQRVLNNIMLPLAKQMAKMTKKKVVLVEFASRTNIREIS